MPNYGVTNLWADRRLFLTSLFAAAVVPLFLFVPAVLNVVQLLSDSFSAVAFAAVSVAAFFIYPFCAGFSFLVPARLSEDFHLLPFRSNCAGVRFYMHLYFPPLFSGLKVQRLYYNKIFPLFLCPQF